MLFVTNRTPKQSIRIRKNRPISFPLSNNDVSQAVYYCRRNDEHQYVEIGANAFMKTVRDDPHKQVLFLIHGFNMLPEAHGGVFEQAQKLQELFDADEGLVQVIPLVWPCDDDAGIVKDYWDDQKSADKSGFSFARVLQKFMRWRDETQPCMKRVNVLAHSMGNRVLRETIRVWRTGTTWRAVFLSSSATFSWWRRTLSTKRSPSGSRGSRFAIQPAM